MPNHGRAHAVPAQHKVYDWVEHNDASVVVILSVVLVPATMPAMVMPTTLLPVFVLISVAIRWRRRVDDGWRLLVDDRGRCHVHRAGNAKIDSNVGAGQSRARCAPNRNSYRS